jgi:hypothetical protein
MVARYDCNSRLFRDGVREDRKEQYLLHLFSLLETAFGMSFVWARASEVQGDHVLKTHKPSRRHLTFGTEDRWGSIDICWISGLAVSTTADTGPHQVNLIL